MTLKELKIIIDKTLEMNSRNENCEVCIPNNMGGQGGTSVTNVKFAGKGFDWDNYKFILYPEVKLTKMIEDEK